MKPQPDKELILDSLAGMAKAAGRQPSRREFLRSSGISEHAVLKFFPSWNAALQGAGLELYTRNMRRDDSELLEDWGCATRRNGETPTCRAYHKLGKFGLRTLEQRFGGWSQVPTAFRKFAEGKPEWADVVALLPPAPKASPKRVAIPGSGLRASPEADAACNAIGDGARGRADLRMGLPRSSRRRRRFRHPPLDGRPTYGKPMDFRGLRHEPVNEQGVVFLFAMIAKELGYIVEGRAIGLPRLRSQAPDRSASLAARSPRI